MSGPNWGPQPGQPGQPGQPQGYPPQPGGYPQPGVPPQYQSQPGYPPQQGQPAGYPPQPGFPPQGGYRPQGAYGPPGYPPQGGGFPPQGQPPARPPAGPPAKKSAGLIIGIVVAAVVLLAAVGGIIIALNRGGGTEPDVTITPGTPSAPASEPNTPAPTPTPTDPTEPPTGPQSTPPQNGDEVDLGNGIAITPANGWRVDKTGKGIASLVKGRNLFIAQAPALKKGTNPGQFCTALHKEIVKGASNAKFSDPKDTDLGTKKLTAATCSAQVTVSNGQGTTTLALFSLVSVRGSDGQGVVGTVIFPTDAFNDQLGKDVDTMLNSMLEGQVNG